METLAQVAALRSRIDSIRAIGRSFSVSNGSTNRSLDCDDADGAISAIPTQAEVENIRDAVLIIADVLGTLLEDIKALR